MLSIEDEGRRVATLAAPPPESLPTVQALASLWREVSRRPLWAPPHFFRYLELRWRARLDLLDETRLRIIAPPGKVNDCSACYDQCCVGKRSTVLLRLRDVAVLKDLGRTELIVSHKPEFAAEELAARPALRRQVQSSGWKTFPVLAQNSFGACVALTGEGRCSLHPYWPLSCARFPYALHLDKHEIFYSRRCDAFCIRHDGANDGRVQAMAAAAVASYNERVKDLILLAYAPQRLGELGLLDFLAPT